MRRVLCAKLDAFMSRVGNLLRSTSSGHAHLDVSASRQSLYQAIRSMSSKLFIGGWRALLRIVRILLSLKPKPTILQYSFAGLSYATDDICLTAAFSGYGEIIEGTRHVQSLSPNFLQMLTITTVNRQEGLSCLMPTFF